MATNYHISEYKHAFDVSHSSANTGYKAISFAELCQLSSIRCEKPYLAKNLLGINTFVPCGRCSSCLRKRRDVWSKRLIDESTDLRCVHAFGFTFTYRPEFLPWLPAADLRSHLNSLKDDVADDIVNSNILDFDEHGFLNVRRGFKDYGIAHDDFIHGLESQKYVSLIQSPDISKFQKRFRKAISDEFGDRFILRFFIAGEYGDTESNCKLCHFHGLCYLMATDYDDARNIKENANFRQMLSYHVENVCLSKWPYAAREWDSQKGKYYGKDIHVFGAGWGNYLGKYIAKNEQSNYALGEAFSPTRIFCSKTNPKYDFGPIGFNSYQRTESYSDCLKELAYCYQNNKLFSPTYVENGYIKHVPTSYVMEMYRDFFKIKPSLYSGFVQKMFPAVKRSRHRASLIRLSHSDIYGYDKPLVVPDVADYINYFHFRCFLKNQRKLYQELRNNDGNHAAYYDINTGDTILRDTGIFASLVLHDREKQLQKCKKIHDDALEYKRQHGAKYEKQDPVSSC